MHQLFGKLWRDVDRPQRYCDSRYRTVAISGTITVLQSTVPGCQASVADSDGDAGIALPAFSLRQLVKPRLGEAAQGEQFPMAPTAQLAPDLVEAASSSWPKVH